VAVICSVDCCPRLCDDAHYRNRGGCRCPASSASVSGLQHWPSSSVGVPRNRLCDILSTNRKRSQLHLEYFL